MMVVTLKVRKSGKRTGLMVFIQKGLFATTVATFSDCKNDQFSRSGLPDAYQIGLSSKITGFSNLILDQMIRKSEGGPHSQKEAFMKFPYKMSRRLFTSATIAVGLIAGAGVSAAEKIKVAAIYTLPVEQQWISRIHKALNTAAESGAIEYTYSENVANTDYERVMREYAEQGQNLIVGEVFGLERAARKVAKDYTDTAFLMGSSFGPVAPNFSVFDNWIHEPSYLTGMVAGSMTKSNVIGMVGGYAIPEVNRLMHAFMDGARDVNPDVKFLVNFIDSWYDPPKAKESAFAMMDAGADIMYAERFGVSDAAVERGVKAIGNVIDTSADYPGTILASAIWHMEATIDKAIANAASGNFEAADYGQYSFMAFGGGSLVLDESLVPGDVATAVKAKEQEILDGLFRVNVNDARPESDG